MKKNVVYTALFGGYDELFEIPDDGRSCCDYICFTDDENLESSSWEIRVVAPTLPSNMMNRMYKILPHKFLHDYDRSLYVDANIIIKRDLSGLVEEHLKNSTFVAMRHPERNCVYLEGLACIVKNKSKFDMVASQLVSYRKLGFPADYGLSNNSVLLRLHNEPHLISLMNSWWAELNKFTQRDQLSLQFLLWKHNIDIKYIDYLFTQKNPYVQRVSHNHIKQGLHFKLFRRSRSVARFVFFSPLFYYKVLRYF